MTFIESELPDDVAKDLTVDNNEQKEKLDFIIPTSPGPGNYNNNRGSFKSGPMGDFADNVDFTNAMGDAASKGDANQLFNLMSEKFGSDTVEQARNLYRAGVGLARLFVMVKGAFPKGGGGPSGPIGPTIEVIDRDPEDEGGKSGGHHPYRLDYNSVPIEERLNTGIKPNTFTPFYHDYVTTHHYPMHVTHAKLNLPYSTHTNAQNLNVFYENVLSFILQNKLQSAVAFSVDLTKLTATTIRDALNALLDALQYYYCYDSILQYCNNPNNKNSAMLSLRSNITAEHINKLYEIRRLLAGLPIPPNMLSLAFYLNQTFQSSSLPGSAIIKMMPVPITQSGLDGSVLSSVITALTDSSNRNVFTVLARACPHWITNNLPGNMPSSVHDPNFTTIWRNLPYYYEWYGTTPFTRYRPSISGGSNNTTIKYSSDTNTLDGGAYALMTAFDGSTPYPLEVPSLIKTVKCDFSGLSIKTNRLSFFGTSDGFQPIYNLFHASNLRDETYTMYSTSLSVTPTVDYNQAPLGTEICESVTVNTITQTAFQVLEWMFTFDSIKPRDLRLKEGSMRSKRKVKSKSK